MSTSIIAYVPVIHQGYVQFLQKYPDSTVYLLDRDITDDWRPLQKDIRALSPTQIKTSLEVLGLTKAVQVVDTQTLGNLSITDQLVMPDETIMHAVAEKYFPNQSITFDSIFLRWDANKSTSPQAVEADVEQTNDEFHQHMMQQTQELAAKSGDWWRQIGGVVVKDEQVVLETYNRHVPSEQQPYIDGDPRADFHKGDHIEVSTALHAEASLIAEAARQGVSLEGASMYVTTFPCPTCAKLVAYSGIKELYFKEGYAMVDGERVLKEQGVRLVKVLEKK